MKIKTITPVTGISGTHKAGVVSATYQARNGGSILMKTGRPPAAPSPLQAQIQQVRSRLAIAWTSLLSSSNRQSWIDAAPLQYAASGYCLFCRLMWFRAALNLSLAQDYADYTGDQLTYEMIEPSLWYDADLTPAVDPAFAQFCLFSAAIGQPIPLTWPTDPVIAFARVMHYPLPAGRSFQPWMATACNSADLATSMLEIEEFFYAAHWSENLCTNGTFTDDDMTGWSTSGDISAFGNRVVCNYDSGAYAQYDALAATPGILHRVTFDAFDADEDTGYIPSMGGITGTVSGAGLAKSFEFTPTTSAPLRMTSVTDDDNQYPAFGNIVIERWVAAQPIEDPIYIQTDIPSQRCRTSLPFFGTIAMVDKATGHSVFSWFGQMTMAGNTHD